MFYNIREFDNNIQLYNIDAYKVKICPIRPMGAVQGEYFETVIILRLWRILFTKRIPLLQSQVIVVSKMLLDDG